MLGYPVLVVPQAEVAHLSKKRTNFDVPWEAYIFNSLRMAIVHFEGELLSKMLDYLSHRPGYNEVWSAL